jgi:phosphoribosyl 1,2-cyclic phosphate phosphodiesterase
VLVSFESAGRRRNVVIDTTPDFRQQALTAGFTWLDAILYTHAHADHIMGLDDVRPFNYGRAERIPAYGSPEALDVIKTAFPYAFDNVQTHPGGVPRLEARCLDKQPVEVFGLEFLPVPVFHGRRTVFGFRFGAAGYVTDQSDIPEESVPLLEGLDVLFLDALRRIPHPSHSTVDQAVAWVERLRPKRTYLTHISHDLGHEETNAELPPRVELAYDGLVIETAGDAR